MRRSAEAHFNMELIHQQRARLAIQSEAQQAYLAAHEPPTQDGDTKPLHLPDMDAAKDFPPSPPCPVCHDPCEYVGTFSDGDHWYCELCGSEWVSRGNSMTLLEVR